MKSTLKVFEKFEFYPICSVIGFIASYEKANRVFGEMYLFRENKPNYMAANNFSISVDVAKLVNFDMQSELFRYMDYSHNHDNLYPEFIKSGNIDRKVSDWSFVKPHEIITNLDVFYDYFKRIKEITGDETIRELINRILRLKVENCTDLVQKLQVIQELNNLLDFAK